MNKFETQYKQLMNESVMDKETLSEMILNILQKQSFENWYNTKLQDYITGEEGAPSKEEILKELQWQITRELNFMRSNLR
jgi:hypothetical protein